MEKNKIFMIVIIALLVLLLGAIGFLVFSFTSFMNKPEETTQMEVAEVTPLSPEEIELIPLEEKINTNLMVGPDGMSHIISIDLSIGVNNTEKKESPKVAEMIITKQDMVRNTCLDVIRSKTYEELNRPDGKSLLSQELLEALRAELKTNLIYQVYIGDLYME